jgi:alpha-mannosidase
VAVWDGRVDAAAVEKIYRQWLTAAPVPKNADDWSATHVNVARPKFGTKAIASSQFGPDYGPEKAIDGKWAARPTDKWNSAANVQPHFLRLDLGQVRTIDRVRIYHEGIMPDGDEPTTADFRVQHSQRQWGPWVDLLKPVRDNRGGITEHVFKPTRTRYVRLLIETGEQNEANTYGRIFELEVYSPKQTVGAPAASTQPKAPTS